MSRNLSESRVGRWLAAAVATLLVAVVPGIGALPASATPVGGTIIVTATENPGIFDDVTFTVTVTPAEGDDCSTNPPTSASWWNDWMQTDALTGAAVGTTYVYSVTRGPLGNDGSMTFTANASGGCAGGSITDDVTVSTPWYQYYAYGYTLQGTAPADSWDDVVAVPGVVVDLLEVSNGADGEPVSSATSDSDGAFTLYAPLTVNDDISRTYKIRYTYPDGGPVLYYNGDSGPWKTSPSTWEEGAADGPATWLNLGYNSYIAAPWSFTGSGTVSGTGRLQIDLYGTEINDYVAAAGIPVALMEYSDGESGTAVDSTTTDENGEYSLDAPVETQEESEREYVIRFTGDDGTKYYYREPSSTETPSTIDFDDATRVSPSTWESGSGFDGYLGTAPPLPSETDWNEICEEGAGSYTTIETSTATWEDLCQSDATIEDAALGELDDAFDTFGEIRFEAGEYDFIPSSADFTLGQSGDSANVSFTDEDEWVYDSTDTLVNVDIAVERQVSGPWLEWAVTVYEAGTSTVADVPFSFDGDLGSDSDTQWAGSGSSRVSSDRSDGDPVIVHQTNGTTWVTDEDEVEVSAVGELTYAVALLGYTGGCIVEATITQAVAFSTSSFGTAPPVLTGGECPPDPSWTIATPDFVVGVPFDETYTANGTGWDWTYGGEIELGDLPDGLEWESLDSWEDGTAPSVRIFGTPTTAGDYSFWGDVQDDWNDYEFEVEGEVVVPAPEKQFDLTLNLQLGDPVAGASVDVEASGLASSSLFDLEVHSTPTVIASGFAAVDGTLATSGTLPTLEAGWHTLIFSGTWYDNTSVLEKLWIKVGADGTLEATSTSAPAAADDTEKLASTGTDPSGGLLLGVIVLLTGVGLYAVRRRRTA